MQSQNAHKWIVLLNIIDVFGVCLVLTLAFIFQFVLNELPCPLCLLQRIGLLGIGFGFLLNIRFNPRPLHYSLSLLAAVLTGFVSLRQILLHIVPGSGGYGIPFLGLHLYTWLFILSVVAIVYISIILSFTSQYLNQVKESKGMHFLVHCAFGFILFLSVANGVSTYMECGLKACPDNPVNYMHEILIK